MSMIEINSTFDQLDEDICTSEQLMEILFNTREQGQIMEHLIKNQIEIKDDRIDKLYKELEYYKQENADRFVNQIMKALIKVRKDMVRLMASNNFVQMSAEELRREYCYICEDMTDLLEQQNIDAYQSEPRDVFDSAIHQAKLERCEDEALDKKIKESISEGYKKGDKVFIPERVVVYQYKA